MTIDKPALRPALPMLLLGGMLLAGLGGLLAGCAGVVVGAGATAATAAAEERGIGQAATDLRIRATIDGLWLNHDEDLVVALDVNISEGRVMVTGVVPNAKMRDDAIRLAWQARGVREVINEIRIAAGEGATAISRASAEPARASPEGGARLAKARARFHARVLAVHDARHAMGLRPAAPPGDGRWPTMQP